MTTSSQLILDVAGVNYSYNDAYGTHYNQNLEEKKQNLHSNSVFYIRNAEEYFHFTPWAIVYTFMNFI